MFTDEELYGKDAVLSPTDGQIPAEDGTTPTDPDRQTETQDTTTTTTTPKPTTPVVDWKSDPAFKQWQSENDRRYEQQRQESLTLRQQLQAYEQQIDNLATRDLDDVGKLRYELAKAQRIIQARAQNDQVEQGKAAIHNMIQEEAKAHGFTVPREAYADAPDADSAWRMAMRYTLTQGVSAKVAERTEKREANAVDLGGGAPVATDSDIQRRYNKATKDFNVKEAYDIMTEADIKGVKLIL